MIDLISSVNKWNFFSASCIESYNLPKNIDYKLSEFSYKINYYNISINSYINILSFIYTHILNIKIF